MHCFCGSNCDNKIYDLGSTRKIGENEGQETCTSTKCTLQRKAFRCSSSGPIKYNALFLENKKTQALNLASGSMSFWPKIQLSFIVG